MTHGKLITLVVIATGQTFQFSRVSYLVFMATFQVFMATVHQCTLLNRVRAAAKISAGGVGSPYNQLYGCELPCL